MHPHYPNFIISSGAENFERAKEGLAASSSSSEEEEVLAVLEGQYKCLSQEERDAWKHRAEALNAHTGASLQAMMDFDEDGGGKPRASSKYPV